MSCDKSLFLVWVPKEKGRRREPTKRCQAIPRTARFLLVSHANDGQQLSRGEPRPVFSPSGPSRSPRLTLPRRGIERDVALGLQIVSHGVDQSTGLSYHVPLHTRTRERLGLKLNIGGPATIRQGHFAANFVEHSHGSHSPSRDAHRGSHRSIPALWTYVRRIPKRRVVRIHGSHRPVDRRERRRPYLSRQRRREYASDLSRVRPVHAGKWLLHFRTFERAQADVG